MGLLSYWYKIWKACKKTSPTISKVNPTVNTTKLEKKISETTKAVQKAKGSGAKLSQSIFELKNNMPITFKGSKTKTISNTELKKKADARIKEKAAEKKEKNTTKIFNAPKNFNKGGRVGLKSGGGSDLGMQSVKHGIDKNPNITAADPKAKFIAKAKNKKSKKKFI